MRRKPDYVFLTLIAILLGVGILALSSASSPTAFARFNDSYYFVKRQFLYGVLPGIAGLLFFARMDYRRIAGGKWFFLIASILPLGLVFLPGLGASFGRTQSWVAVGSFSFQPAEISKLFFVAFLASYFRNVHSSELRSWKILLPPTLVSVAIAALLILQPDIGTLGIFLVIASVVIFVAGIPWKYLLMVAVSFAAAGWILIKTAPYRAARFTVFLNPELDPKGIGYQINQAFLAIGSGGFWGRGLGLSRQKFQYLPEVIADSIFAVMAEELGFIMIVGFLLLLLAIFFRALRIARGASDRFGLLFVVGAAAWIIFQSLINIGAMVGVLPLTGLPLPFVSHGGTAMMVSLWAVGLILSISRYAQKE